MPRPQLLGPHGLAGALLEALQPTVHARREEPFADDQRRGVRTVALLGRIAVERHRRGVLPQRRAGGGVDGDHHFLVAAAVHRVERVRLDRRRRVPVPAELPLPDDRGTRCGPGVLERRRLGLEVPVRAAPLRPGHGSTRGGGGWGLGRYGRRRGWLGRRPRCLLKGRERCGETQERTPIHDGCPFRPGASDAPV